MYLTPHPFLPRFWYVRCVPHLLSLALAAVVNIFAFKCFWKMPPPPPPRPAPGSCLSALWEFQAKQNRSKLSVPVWGATGQVKPNHHDPLRNKVCSVCSSTRNPHQDIQVPSSRLLPIQGSENGARISQNAPAISYRDAASFPPGLSIHLVAINLWLVSRVPIKFIWPVCSLSL